MEKSFWSHIREADFRRCLKASDFQFKKKRMIFIRLLNSSSKDIKRQTVDPTRSVVDAVLSQQDEESTLAILEAFDKDDNGSRSRLRGLFRSSGGEEGLWECASRNALSVSDSQFLSELKAIPVDHYLHEAVDEVENAAYTSLTKLADALVSKLSQLILLTQKKECDKRVQREADSDEAREVQRLWSEFVHQIEDVSTQRSTSYVPYGARNRLTT